MSPTATVAVLSLGLVLAQAGSMTFPALMPVLMAEWGMGESQAGWIVGMYFAGYAIAVPVLSALTDRVDARPIVVGCGLLAGVSVAAFPLCAGQPMLAMLARLATGVGVAGVHMPGLGLLAERLAGPARARGASAYAACYAMGTAGSFLIAGLVAPRWGWEATFVVSGALALLIAPLIALIEAVPRATSAKPRGALLDFRPVVRNRSALAYTIAYAGNTWEVFGVRAWMVAFLGYSMARDGGGAAAGWSPAMITAMSVLLGVVAGLGVAEVAVRHNRPAVIAATGAASVLVALAIASEVTAPTALVALLLLLHGATSYGDAPSISAGVVEAADPAQRGATLAVFALAGFLPGLAAPLVIGTLLEATGGVGSPEAWRGAFSVIAMGSVVSIAAMALARRKA